MQDKNSAAEAMGVLDLISLKNIFDDYNIPTALLEKSDVLPLASLVVNPNPDYKKRTRTLSFSFLPLEEEAFEDIKVLQIYSEFNFEIKEAHLSDMETLILRLNKLLVLGSFGISDSNRVFYRYVHSMAKYASLRDLEDPLVSLLNLMLHALDVNAATLESVGLGEVALEAAYQQFVAT